MSQMVEYELIKVLERIDQRIEKLDQKIEQVEQRVTQKIEKLEEKVDQVIQSQTKLEVEMVNVKEDIRELKTESKIAQRWIIGIVLTILSLVALVLTRVFNILP